MLADLRFAFRQFAKARGFTAAVVSITAIGIGAVTLMYSVFWGVVLQPLSFSDPDRLVGIQATTNQGTPNSLSAADYFDYREQCDGFSSLAACSIWRPGCVVLGSSDPERVTSNKVSYNFFETFGMNPVLGRGFLAGEEASGAPLVVVIGHDFWQRRLNGGPDVIGSKLAIDDAVYEIVGVAPAGFDYPGDVELWFPLQRGGPEESGRGNNNYVIVGRLADGVTLAQARSQMEVAAARISDAYPGEKGGWGVMLTPLHEQIFGNLRQTMLMLMGATVLVLLTACANLSSLLLARVMTRRGEIAIRRSLGASTGVVARQLLIETVVIISIGAVAGVVLAMLGTDVIKALAPANTPRLAEVSLNARVLAVAFGATALTALFSSLFPALRGGRVNLANHLHQGGRNVAGRGHLAMRRTLVTTQVALSLVLLVVTGLLLQSAVRLQRVDPGFDPDRLLIVNVQLPTAGENGPRLWQRFDALLERIRVVPGVASVAAADQLPLFGGPWNGVYRPDRPPQSSSDLPRATRRFVAPSFFETMRIPLLAGRRFDPRDRPGPPYKTIVSHALAQRLFPDEEAVGRILVLPWGDGVPLEIIGVAADVRDFGLAADFRPAFYGSLSQLQDIVDLPTLRLVIRCQGDPFALIPSVRSAIHELEKNAPLYDIGTMRGRLSDSTARNRFSTTLLGIFALVAIFLAATGLHGVLSFLVAQRTRELGIRIALGAQVQSVVRLVIRQGMWLATAGIVVGLVGALLATRFVASQLYNVSSTDVPTFVVAALVLAGAALLACWLPARRVTRIDPMETLRAE